MNASKSSQLNEFFSNAAKHPAHVFDYTVPLLERSSLERDLYPDEQIFLDAEEISKRYQRTLDYSNVKDYLFSREDYRSDYYAGALAALRKNVTEPKDISSAGKRSMYDSRKPASSRRLNRTKNKENPNRVIFLSLNRDMLRDDSGESRTFIEFLQEDPDRYLRELLNSGTLEGCIDQLPNPGQRIMRALTYGEYFNGRFYVPAVDELADRLDISPDQLIAQYDQSCDILREMLPKAIKDAPSHPSAQQP